VRYVLGASVQRAAGRMRVPDLDDGVAVRFPAANPARRRRQRYLATAIPLEGAA
jgi:hypothetical protein